MAGLNNPINVYCYIPTNPLVVVYLFNGIGGDARSFIVGIEMRSFINIACAEGYVIIAIQGEENV